jgi:hypothetical protein
LISAVRRVALPLVAAAQVVADLGSCVWAHLPVHSRRDPVGPWTCVAQIAAVERLNWFDCLRQSWRRTRGLAFHIIAVVRAVTLPLIAIDRVVALLLPTRTNSVTLLIGVVWELISISVVPLTQAVLYSDIQARDASRRG